MSDIQHTVAHAYRRGYIDAMNAARAWAGLAMWCMCGDGGKYGAALHQNLTDRAWQALRDWLNATKEYQA